MAAKAVIILFAQALFIQSALTQNCGRTSFAATPTTYNLAAPTFGYDAFTSGFAGNNLPCNRLAGNNLAFNGLSSNIINAPIVEITPTSGGALPVTSASPIAPNSIVVESENIYEGTLAVAGELPFVGTVGLEGDLPTVGSGAVNHACGNGATRMVSQDGAAMVNNFGTGFAPATAFGSGNVYGSVGGFGNAAATNPFGYNAGLAGLSYPATGLAGSYPATGFTSGLAPYGTMGSAYGGVLSPASPYVDFIAPAATYGGAGEGNVAVAGELPVAGNTALAGQVPIMGAVSFGGAVPAAGAVSITGNCACGCGYQYLY